MKQAQPQKNHTPEILYTVFQCVLNSNLLGPQSLGRLLLTSSTVLRDSLGRNITDEEAKQPTYTLLHEPISRLFFEPKATVRPENWRQYLAYESRNPGKTTFPANTTAGRRLNLMQMRTLLLKQQTLLQKTIQEANCWRQGLNAKGLEVLQDEKKSAFEVFTENKDCRHDWCREFDGGHELLEHLKGKHSLDLNAQVETLKRVKALLIGGASLEVTDTRGLTALEYVAMTKDKHLTPSLLKHGANPRISEALFKNLWVQATSEGNLKIASQLLAHGLPPKGIINTSKQTLLHIAIVKGHLEIASLLLEHGASLEEKDINQRTPLNWAAWHNNDKAMQLLLDKGAEVTTHDRQGNTPLHFTAESRKTACTSLLLKHKADPMALNNVGETPLRNARDFKGAEENVRLLEKKITAVKGRAPSP